LNPWATDHAENDGLSILGECIECQRPLFKPPERIAEMHFDQEPRLAGTRETHEIRERLRCQDLANTELVNCRTEERLVERSEQRQTAVRKLRALLQRSHKLRRVSRLQLQNSL
jgi:2-polyprenyl-6-methoxyphenol hydroxylase-like FAD-dependent oxidoreductase